MRLEMRQIQGHHKWIFRIEISQAYRILVGLISYELINWEMSGGITGKFKLPMPLFIIWQLHCGA